MLTYKQAYDLLIDAYYKDEIKPYDTCFCFCGNLNERCPDWRNQSYGINNKEHFNGINYTGVEFYKMEYALLDYIHRHYNTINICSSLFFNKNIDYVFLQKDYEDVLFEAFCKALDVLKQIHIERGEVIDEVCELSKRVLVK